MRKHLSLMLLLLLLITCTACGQRQTVQRMAADRITQAESVAIRGPPARYRRC